jgi:tight adherence protein B
MRRLLVLALLGLLLLPAALPALAQDAEDERLDVAPIDFSDHPTLTTVLTAPQALVGRRLRAGDITVEQDGRPVPVGVEQLPADELEVVLLVDTSGSMRGAMETAKDAAVSFVEGLPAGVRASVLGFGTQVTVVSEFSDEADATMAALRTLQPGGETALYDALDVALDQFDPADGTRRAIVLLSDGGDTASTTDIETIRGRLADAGTALYGVELLTPESDPAALASLTDATGGQVASATSAAGLAAVYAEISSLLVNQYMLTFDVTGAGPSTFSFRLEADDSAAAVEQSVRLPAAPAAPTGAPTLTIASIDSSEHPQVELRIIAPRALSERELAPGAFTIVEDGQERALRAERITALDLEVILAIDTSGSMSGAAIAGAKAAGVGFVQSMLPGTRVALHAFDDEPRVVLDFTTDTDALIEAITGLELGGETALYDAAISAVDAFATRPDSARSLVVLSDGGDTVSRVSRDETVRRLAGSGISLHAIELQSPENDRSALEALVAPSDGEVTGVEDPRALTAAFAAVGQDIANQYVLRYTSESFGSSAVRVTIDAGGVTAEASRAVDLPPAPVARTFFGSRTALFIGAALWYVAMALVILAILSPQRTATQLRGAANRVAGGQSGLSDAAGRASAAAQRGLQRGGYDRSLNTALERAGIDLRAGEYVVLAACAALGAFALGFVSNGFLVALLLAGVAVFTSRFVLSFKADRRQAKFADQLGDTLQLLSGSLRAGYSLLQAVDAVAREADAPSSEEFGRLVVETRLGRDLGDAMQAMDRRVRTEDFNWVMQAIEIHREVGGDLAEVLDTVAGTIRERNQIRRQVKALSAEGRLSAYVLMALPIGVGGMIAITNPSYLGELTNGGLLGWGLIGMAVLLMTGGALWLRKLVKIVF